MNQQIKKGNFFTAPTLIIFPVFLLLRILRQNSPVKSSSYSLQKQLPILFWAISRYNIRHDKTQCHILSIKATGVSATTLYSII